MSLVSSWRENYEAPVVEDYLPTWVKRKQKKKPVVITPPKEVLAYVRSLKGQ